MWKEMVLKDIFRIRGLKDNYQLLNVSNHGEKKKIK